MEIEYVIRQMEVYADEKGIPIMEKNGMKFLTEFIRLNNIKNVLEIGSAIGYSAINIALTGDDVYVTTVERDKDRYIEAVKNIKKVNLDNRITLILQDALDFNINDKFDLIFIDAAKSQYIKFFEKFSKNLKPGGYIITDNIGFHGLVNSDKTNCVIEGTANSTYFYQITTTNNAGLTKTVTGNTKTQAFSSIKINLSPVDWSSSKNITIDGVTSGATLEYKVVSGTTVKQNWT